MDRFNTSRTNSSTAAGPTTAPTFQTLASVSGTLRRIANDGSLILVDQAAGQSVGTVASYTNSGQLKWSHQLETANGLGIVDVAVGADGTVYASTTDSVTAVDGTTGAPVWSVTTNSGANESSPLAIGNNGTIYFHSGSSAVGTPEKISAINPDGTIKWEALPGFRGNTRIAFSTDQSLAFAINTKSSPGGPIGNVSSFSTVDGHLVSNTPCDPRGGILAFSPAANILYTFDVNGNLLALTPDLQLCSTLTVPFVLDIAAITPGGNLVITNGDNTIKAVTATNTQLWQLSEQFTQVISDNRGTLFAVDPQTGDLVALSSAAGSILWRQHFVNPITGEFLGSDGNIYLTSGTALFASSSAAALGTISVSTNNAAATFTIADGSGHSFSGSGMSFTQAALPGTYGIQYRAVPLLITPPQQTQTLTAGGTVTFIGIYQPQPPILQLSATTLDFTTQILGLKGQAQIVSVTNVGGSDSHLSINIVGDFGKATDCNAILAVGSSCVVNITFQPNDEGTFAGILSFADAGAGVSMLVHLSGTALLPPLVFPLHGVTPGVEEHLDPQTAPMTSVFDHHMMNNAGHFMSYGCDGTVEDFRKEIGMSTALRPPCDTVAHKGYPSAESIIKPFRPTQAYVSNALLFYDGHPGYDFRSRFGNEVYAAASGIIHYPTLTELRKRDLLTVGGDPDDLHVLEIEVANRFKIFYLHLSTHPRSVSISLDSSTNPQDDLDFAATPNLDFTINRAVTKRLNLHGNFRLSGRVTQGVSPLPNVAVQLTGSTSSNNCVFAVTQTDLNGHYEFIGLVSGHYNIRPIRKGLEFDAVHSKAILPEGSVISVDGADVLIARSGNASIAGAKTCVIPHLHFEVQRALRSPRTFPALGQDLNFVPVDPYGWNPPQSNDEDPYFQVDELNGAGLVNKRLWKR